MTNIDKPTDEQIVATFWQIMNKLQTEYSGAMLIQVSAQAIANECARANSEKSEMTIHGLSRNGERLGDWVVTCNKVKD